MIKLLWRKRSKRELDELEKKAMLTHRENIDKIVNSRNSVDKLKRVLSENNITIELARAMGH